MNNNLQLTSQGASFPNYVNKPDIDIKGGLIVIHEVWGLTDHIRQVADRFAGEGYKVIAPDLLEGAGIDNQAVDKLQLDLFDPKRRNLAQLKLRKLMTPLQHPDFAKNTLYKLDSCFEYMHNELSAQKNIGIVGYCFGGTYSFSFAAQESRLKAAVPFYGHCNLTLDQLKNIACPMLAFYGENDANLMTDLPVVIEKMKKANVNFSYQVYKDCGHAFFNSTNHFAYNATAANDAWQKTLRFLETNLA